MSQPEKILVAVIIPYYQKERDILSKSVQSVLMQTDLESVNFQIIIIDDSSPIGANKALPDEIKALPYVVILEQQNKGPAGARNTGLNAVPAHTRYIAFLDSDDVWTPNHLSNAIKALEAGYDFYFSDFYQLDQDVTAFNRAKRINVNNHPLLFVECEYLHSYQGSMKTQIITGNIIGTPTVVYRFALNQKLRFREDLVRAGEDYLFWLELNKVSSLVVFSSLPECVCGKGVNVYSGTKFGSEEYIELVYFEAKYRKTILREFSLDSTEKSKLKSKIKEQHINLLRALLQSIRRGYLIDKRIFWAYLKMNPEFVYYLPFNLIKIVTEKLRVPAQVN